MVLLSLGWICFVAIVVGIFLRGQHVLERADEGALYGGAMAALAAATVAVLTVRTTDTRQTRQLTAGKADLEQQLLHARALANIDDVRDVLQHGLKARDEVMAVARLKDPDRESAHRKARAEVRKANNRMRLRGDLVPQRPWEDLQVALLEVVNKSPAAPKSDQDYQDEYDAVFEAQKRYEKAAIAAIERLVKDPRTAFASSLTSGRDTPGST
jgi:hypothetical protein